MATTLNKVLLIGHLGRDAEIKYTTQGLAILSFSIATNHSIKDKDGNWKTETTWHDIKCFKDMAERYKDLLKKGKKIYCEGRLNKNSYTDSNQIKRWNIEVIADQIILLEKAEGESTYTEAQFEEKPNVQVQEGNVTTDIEEDLPF